MRRWIYNFFVYKVLCYSIIKTKKTKIKKNIEEIIKSLENSVNPELIRIKNYSFTKEGSETHRIYKKKATLYNQDIVIRVLFNNQNKVLEVIPKEVMKLFCSLFKQKLDFSSFSNLFFLQNVVELEKEK